VFGIEVGSEGSIAVEVEDKVGFAESDSGRSRQPDLQYALGSKWTAASGLQLRSGIAIRTGEWIPTSGRDCGECPYADPDLDATHHPGRGLTASTKQIRASDRQPVSGYGVASRLGARESSQVAARSRPGSPSSNPLVVVMQAPPISGDPDPCCLNRRPGSRTENCHETVQHGEPSFQGASVTWREVNGALVVKAIGAPLFAQNRTELQTCSCGGRSLFVDRPTRKRRQPSDSGGQRPETLSDSLSIR